MSVEHVPDIAIDRTAPVFRRNKFLLVLLCSCAQAQRLEELKQAQAGMTDEELAVSEKREKERQLERLANERMAKQLEAQKVMQKKLERADRERRRKAKAAKKAAKAAKLKQKKLIGKEKRKREILAKRSLAKK